MKRFAHRFAKRCVLAPAAALALLAAACSGAPASQDVITGADTADPSAAARTAPQPDQQADRSASQQTAPVSDDERAAPAATTQAADTDTGADAADADADAGAGADGAALTDDEALALARAALNSTTDVAVRGEMRNGAISGGAFLSFAVDDEGDLAMQLNSDGSGLLDDETAAAMSTYEVRYVAPYAYVKFDMPDEMRQAHPELLLDGQPGWWTIDMSAEKFRELCSSWSLATASSEDPCSAPSDLGFIEDFVLSASFVGSETIRETQTTRLAVTLDFAGMADYGASLFGLDGTGDDEESDELMVLDELMPDTLTVGIWVDADQQLRRIRFDFAELLSDMLGGLGLDDTTDEPDVFGDLFALVVDVYDYGADIDVTAPGPDEIVGDTFDLDGFSDGLLDDLLL